MLVGGKLTILKHMSQWGWDYPKKYGKKKCLKPPTRMVIIIMVIVNNGYNK